MLLLFENEEGPRAHGLKNKPQLQVESLWVQRERVRQPSLERPAACFSALFLPGVRYLVEYFFLDYGPQTPKKHLAIIVNRDLQTPSNKEESFVDNALV